MNDEGTGLCGQSRDHDLTPGCSVLMTIVRVWYAARMTCGSSVGCSPQLQQHAQWDWVGIRHSSAGREMGRTEASRECPQPTDFPVTLRGKHDMNMHHGDVSSKGANRV